MKSFSIKIVCQIDSIAPTKLNLFCFKIIINSLRKNLNHIAQSIMFRLLWEKSLKQSIFT
ncbi:hypothetical protein BpHYR1_051290 [Brachionus plicatilis]|uniref:Uncharacterized protein n=1 Tax=Brachionus plicatilis TaxID=10195 RepID=A0A3M7S8H3_BRAPC|nr:hypothetical protein BpHYR1_051290 [Brachionus plicatilis]